MKVCLITRFFDLRNGGIGRFSMELKAELKKRGVSIVTVSDPGSYSGQSYLKYTLLSLRKLIPRDCDVYHCLTPSESLYTPKERTIATFHDLIPWLHSRRLVTHYTGLSIRGEINRFISRQYFHLVARSAAKSARVVCVSDTVAAEVVRYLHADVSRVSVIRLGINSALRPAPKPDGTYRIGTLSYLDARKRIDLLIRSFLEAGIDGELVIAGEGQDRRRLEALAGGDRRIRFLGFLPEEKTPDFFNSLDLFVFPTRIEGYGLPIVEAMACGKPVIVLDDGVIPLELKQRCTVTKNLTETLLEGRQLRPAADGIAFARSHSWNACADAYLRLYEEVTGEKRP